MQATDVMTRAVVTIDPETPIQQIAQRLMHHRISAVPVVDADGRVVGIVSESDLLRRAVAGAETGISAWLKAAFSEESAADAFVKAHGRVAADVMTGDVTCVAEDTDLGEIARILARGGIKRVPVVRDGRLVGIVSRANLLQGFAAATDVSAAGTSQDDRAIRDAVERVVSTEAGIAAGSVNVVVKDGAVQLWGLVESESERRAAQIAAEECPGVTAVENNLGFRHGPVLSD